MSTGQTRYWCHICNAEVNIYMAPEPTCQQCNEQFIEELQSDDDPREFLSGNDNTVNGETNIHIMDSGGHIFGSGGRMNGEMGDDIFQYFTPPSTAANTDDTEGNNNAPLNTFLQNLMSSMMGQHGDMNHVEGGTTRPQMYVGSMVDGNMQFRPMGTAGNTEEGNEDTPATERGTEGAGAGGPRGNNIASIMQFLSAMTGAPLDAGLVGNPNDYVFSQNALDNIITQLMEQTGGASAPPPASDQVIDALPKRPLTEKEKSTEADCAVCKDAFEPQEMVIELPCDHVFHDDCIKPWLKLNGTCPVCRRSVLPEGNDTNENNSDSTTTHQDNNNTQDTHDSSTGGNNQNNNTTIRSATWTTGGNGTAQFPLNLSAAFPWNIQGIRTNDNNNTNSNNTNNNNTSTSANDMMDDDLELD